jgi:hypothetical protein
MGEFFGEIAILRILQFVVHYHEYSSLYVIIINFTQVLQLSA